jgi:DNA replication and repair protein RecF
LRFFQITPHSFRNLASDPVFFGPGLHVVAGDNGQGKTNLLEAAALLCGQRSFRRARPADCAPAGGEAFAVSGDVERAGTTERLRVEWTRGAGRRFFRGEKAATFRDVSEIAPAVFLAPEHREIIGGSPEARRRFVDRLVLGLRPAAGDDLLRFERALAMRNALLSRAAPRSPAAGELETWTEELVLAGSAVRRHRADALADWAAFFAPLARAAGAPYADLAASYPAAATTADAFRGECERALPVERRRGHSLCGPHRDDLVWTRGARPLAAESSSGELHRAVALVKLAEWHALARARSTTPLFAVDDFDAGLSRASVDALLAALPPAEQILLTTASEPASWKGRAAATVVWMRAGRALAPAPSGAVPVSRQGAR